MSTLLMLYPSPVLSKMIDPMRLAVERGRALSTEELSAIALERARHLASRMRGVRRHGDGRQDQAWYWAAIGMRDLKRHSGTADWLQSREGWHSVMNRDKEQSDGSIFSEHVEHFMQRAGVVREAFNSPFRQFILATTSIGQEGLDFHSYCHRVGRWNLPHNPVDMEQREGRANRYKRPCRAQECRAIN